MAMTTLQRSTLNKTLEVLTEDLDVIPAIIHFKSKRILTENDGETIIAKVTEKEKVMEFIKIIKKRGTTAYSIFYEYLENYPGSKHLAEELDNNLKQLEREHKEQIDRWPKIEDKFYNFKCTHETISCYRGIPEKINILLIGKTGSGKSATGNTIIGSPRFEECGSSQSVTRTIETQATTEGGINITVTDTPGLFDTAKSDGNEISENEDLMLEIAKAILRFNTGIHLFLVVCNPMVKFTKEEQETINMIEKILSKDIYNNCVVILTNASAKFGGKKMEPLKDYVKREIETEGKFAELLAQVKGNIIAVENCFDEDFLEEIHREKFLCCLAQVIEANKGSVYSNELFEASQKSLEELEKEREKRVKRADELITMKLWITNYLDTLSEQQLSSIIPVLPEDIKRIRCQSGVLTLESITKDDVQEYVSCFIQGDKFLVSKLKDMKLQRTREVTERPIHEKLQKTAFSQISNTLKSFLTKKNLKQFNRLKADVEQDKVPEEIKNQILKHFSTEQKELLGNEVIEREILTQLTQQIHLTEELMEIAKKCFAGSTKVSIKWRGNAKISNVKVGDEILVYDENGHLFYDKVYLLSHAVEDESITFIRLKTSSGKELFISPGHLLPAGNLCRNVSATDISIGDIIFTLQNSEMTSDTVTSITYELCRGAYCPMTMHGTIVVNDVAASCYTTFFPARLAHVLLFPIRFLFGYLPLRLFHGLFPYDAEEGMPILLLRCRNMITTWRSFVRIYNPCEY